ncbi:hypothetical protein ACIGC1_14645 [Peribacillus butanolivorans]
MRFKFYVDPSVGLAHVTYALTAHIDSTLSLGYTADINDPIVFVLA